MEVLFATNNPAKVKIYANRLEENGINLKTLADLNIADSVEENGKNSIENAIIKAKGYNAKDDDVIKFILSSLNLGDSPKSSER